MNLSLPALTIPALTLPVLVLCVLTCVIYFSTASIQQKLSLIWLNPILFSIVLIIALLLYWEVPYNEYFSAMQWLNHLIEFTVVALGYPLFKQLSHIKLHWKVILLILGLGAFVAILMSFMLTMLVISSPEIAISFSLKSVTTPIGVALTQQLGGSSSITAVAIIIAGLLGAMLGLTWLKLINVKSNIAQGLAVGAASHVIGSAAMVKVSYIHAAYSSLALIFSGLLTALISPLLIPTLIKLF
ncbi:MAG: LrgB family protein [Colwellia sp.]